MAYHTKVVILLILTGLIACQHQAGETKSDSQLSDILISQKGTGKVVEGQPEYRVTIENKCSCPQADVKVRCYGVDSVEELDRSKIRPLDDELCIIADGNPITNGLAVIFTSAFQTPQDFFPVVSAKPWC